VSGVFVAALVIGVPAMVFALWPIFTRRGGTLLSLPRDARAELNEQKRAVLRALRELEFEHGAGHLSDADFAELRARYEGEAATVLTELDRLSPVTEPDASRDGRASRSASDARGEPVTARAAGRETRGWRHPLAVGGAAVALVTFGIAIGVGIVRYTSPDSNAGTPMPGSRPLADLSGTADVPGMNADVPGRNADVPGMNAGAGMNVDAPRIPGAGANASGPPRPISPEIMKRMLEAARSALFEGNYKAAIAAYEAVLKRDPKNVDAMTHLGLIAAMAGHTDVGMETIDRALALDPNFGPALLYRGQILYESRKDVPGAIRSWEKFVSIAPPGEDRDRVTKMIADAKKAPPAKSK